MEIHFSISGPLSRVLLVIVQEVCAQFLWESKARVLIDFTPGAAMMGKAALMLNVKSILATHSDHHSKMLKKILVDFVLGDLKSQTHTALSKYAPADYQARMGTLKPERLAKWLSQRKRGLEAKPDETPNNKRMALAANVDNFLGQFDGAPPKPNKPKAEAKSEVPQEPKSEVPPAPKPEMPTPQPSPGKSEGSAGKSEGLAGKSEGSPEPAKDLAALLKTWAAG